MNFVRIYSMEMATIGKYKNSVRGAFYFDENSIGLYVSLRIFYDPVYQTFININFLHVHQIFI